MKFKPQHTADVLLDMARGEDDGYFEIRSPRNENHFITCQVWHLTGEYQFYSMFRGSVAVSKQYVDEMFDTWRDLK